MNLNNIRSLLTADEWAAVIKIHKGDWFAVSKPMKARLVLLGLAVGSSKVELSLLGRKAAAEAFREMAVNLATRRVGGI